MNLNARIPPKRLRPMMFSSVKHPSHRSIMKSSFINALCPKTPLHYSCLLRAPAVRRSSQLEYRSTHECDTEATSRLCSHRSRIHSSWDVALPIKHS